jgi:hypothetical protein
VSERGEECAGLPVPVRDARDQTLTARRAAVAAGHVRGGPGFVEEDEPCRVQRRSALPPGAGFGDV